MTNLIDSQTVWNLRPEWIPGQVKRKSDNIICIEVKVPLRDPDGNDLREVNCDKSRCPTIEIGRKVLFSATVVQADKSLTLEKDGSTRQPQQIDVGELRIVEQEKYRDEYNRAVKEFATVDKRIEHLAELRAEAMMTPEREKIDEAWTEYFSNAEKHKQECQSLNLASSALANEQADLAERQQELIKAQQKLEQDTLQFKQVGGSLLLQLISRADEADSVESQQLPKLDDKQPSVSLVSDLDQYFQKQSYKVEKYRLLQTLLCICVGAATGQFVVLTGPPGSGKTSLVRKIAQAIGAGSGIVPVRPAWIDATDLIGFYNPGINRYQPTPFLDYVLQAKRSDELNRLYLLVLDEMNLGRVENYAADFLSLLEKARQDEKGATLQLYSGEIKNRFDAEQEKYSSDDSRKTLLQKHQLDYPSRLPFPNGLVLLGTINVDETTHLPSPKFLDRSLTIQVSGTELPAELLPPSDRATTEAFSWASSLATAQKCLEAGKELTPAALVSWKMLIKWNEDYFKPLGVRLSHRLPQVYRCYMGAASVLKISDHQTIAETFVLSKIMPLVSFRDGDKSETSPEESKRNVLERWRDGKDQKEGVMDMATEFPHVHAALVAILSRPGMIVRYLE